MDILGEKGLESLTVLSRSRTLVAFDFDGTLAHIVTDRDRAAIRPKTRDLLAAVCAEYPSAVISGRSLDDVAGRLEGTGIRHAVGNHGLEPSEGLEDFARATEKAVQRLSERLAACDVEIEHKRYSLAIHYRKSRHPHEAEREIRDAVDGLSAAMRLIPGKLVLNLVPHGAPNKGDALRRLKAIENCDAALYVGDDVTDEDVFCMERSGEVVAVRVGRSRSSAAPWYLADQEGLDELLAALVSLRADPPP